MTPNDFASLSMLAALHLVPALLGAGFVLLVLLLPWRWARWLVGWGVGALLFLIGNALLYVGHGMSPYPGPALAFAAGAIWLAWHQRRRTPD